jgi:hypothetical protein
MTRFTLADLSDTRRPRIHVYGDQLAEEPGGSLVIEGVSRVEPAGEQPSAAAHAAAAGHAAQHAAAAVTTAGTLVYTREDWRLVETTPAAQ